MTAEDVLRLSDLNLAAYIREMTRWNAPGEIFEQDDPDIRRAGHDDGSSIKRYRST
jgi:hypothetical protein